MPTNLDTATVVAYSIKQGDSFEASTIKEPVYFPSLSLSFLGVGKGNVPWYVHMEVRRQPVEGSSHPRLPWSREWDSGHQT